MGWLRRHKIVEAIVDPSSRELSMSRIASGVMLLLDAVWLIVVIAGLPPHQAFAPVSSMLSACTVATFGAYGLNSFGGAWGRFHSMIAPEPPVEPPRPRVKPKGESQ